MAIAGSCSKRTQVAMNTAAGRLQILPIAKLSLDRCLSDWLERGTLRKKKKGAFDWHLNDTA